MISRGLVLELLTGVTSIDGLHEEVKDVFKMGIEELLNAELDEELGYTKFDRSKKASGNSRNGYHKPKTIRSEFGEIEIRAPRDRDGVFQPKILEPYQREAGNFERKIIALYASGNSLLDIKNHIHDLYGVDISTSFVSKITDRILPEIEQWKKRPLESTYPFIFMDAIHINLRSEGHVSKHAVYVMVGINLRGEKDIIGFWVGDNESATYWTSVLENVKSRGVSEVLLFCADGLSGLKEAINVVYPGAVLQRCIVHQLRNTFKHISHKDLREVANDMKTVYKAASADIGFKNLAEVEIKWNSRYPNAFDSWYENWDVLSPFFQYPPEVKKIIYTTNLIESLNRQLRKVTKTKNMFPTDTALEKSLYLCIRSVLKRWNPYKNWDSVIAQLKIMFPEKLIGVHI